MLSCDTDRVYTKHRSGTHNAGVAGSSPAPAIAGHEVTPSRTPVAMQGGPDSDPSGRKFCVCPEVALTLALSSQEPRTSMFAWHLIRVNDKTNEIKTVASTHAPSRVEAERVFRQTWGGSWPSDWTVVAEVALASMRPIPRQAKWHRGQNR